MAESWVAIANLALVNIPGDTRISDLLEGSEAANRINDVLPNCIDEVLEAHPWNAATRRFVVPASADPLPWGNENCYRLPSEPYVLRVLGLDRDRHGRDPVWRVEERKILTPEAAPLHIEAIIRLSDPRLFTGSLESTLAWCIASKIAYRLTGKLGAEERAERKYIASLADARSIDGKQQSDAEAEEATLILARH